MNRKVLEKNWILLLKIFLAIICLAVLFEYLLHEVTGRVQVSEAIVSKTDFVQCLGKKGLVMYGSDTCEYCQNQKKMFGSSFERINYVNCDFDKQICQEKGISGYPVWEINGSLYPGVKTFDQLEQATGCVAPK